ncbi:MAG: hypothetical protein A2Y57_02985 [Candidatus Woykebacteria bacterium RBG_13_40_7b]|uniref:HAD family hydrolase n=1 Tax=Candidatus Woykebacteria bacterium RBG_13_40_7b TaxID=1802594 RepID=A0A1G1W7P4_9BACT|nr:MAG: hypothetical protein A2Y57_02985 [Candidatus Woykebacteria bacterium RBG_13_40_7b]
MKIVVFDFNRTIYDPDSKKLSDGAKFVLKNLIKRGFSLILITKGDQRGNLVKNLGLDKYFKRIIVSKEKTKKDFEEIVSREKADLEGSFVIGDRVRKEITFGNSLGFKTIWFRNGKFAGEQPINEIEKPEYTVEKLKDVLQIIQR